MMNLYRVVSCSLLGVSMAVSVARASSQGPPFVDAAAATGLRFTQFNGMSGAFYFAENLGGGAALLDYDNDGDLDVYLTQGHMLGKGKPLADALFPPPKDQPLTDRLFRNDLVVDAQGRARLHFTDVTEQAGLHGDGYGMGAAAADYDGDGRVDLLVTNLEGVRLLHNEGKGRFRDVTEVSGVDNPYWSVSASFFDQDGDGRLDLYVANYVQFSPQKNVACFAPDSARDYCSPNVYPVAPDRLFHNLGQGRFEDVTARAGLNRADGPGLGVVAADFNGDRRVDLYVANDARPNQLWIQQPDGTFQDDGFMAGTAVNMDGKAEASMGVDAADFDDDGDLDLFMTHLQGETNTLYVNDGQGWFEDRSLATGLGTPSTQFTAFGTGWFDYDNDGVLDLFAANGEVRTVPILVHAGDRYPLRQPNQLFHGLGKGHFADVSRQSGPALARSEVSRGAAFGDLDNDGDTDIVVVNNSGPVRLLLNRLGNRNHWLGLDLRRADGREALGARVELLRKGQPTHWGRARRDGSYASSNDPRVLLGLGKRADGGLLRVHWPDGRIEVWRGLAVDRYHVLVQGQSQDSPGKTHGGT